MDRFWSNSVTENASTVELGEIMEKEKQKVAEARNVHLWASVGQEWHQASEDEAVRAGTERLRASARLRDVAGALSGSLGRRTLLRRVAVAALCLALIPLAIIILRLV
jgi:hypothetical protein